MTAHVDLITGFLGAGKTTFLIRYAGWLERQGIRFTVVENEFGAAGVDCAVLREKMEHVHELSGGCICCTLKTGFYSMLAELSGEYERILVEPSGLFDMDDFFEVLWTLEREGLCREGMCLTLMDPHTLPNLKEQEFEVLYTELTGTGSVLWTQVDVPPPPDLRAAAQDVRAVLGMDAPLDFYPVPAHLLGDSDFPILQGKTPVHRRHHRRMINHNRIFQSTSLRLKGMFEQRSLTAVLDQMMDGQSCGEISRIKGFVQTDTGSLSVNYTVGGRSVVPCAQSKSMLNVIGRQLNRSQMKAMIEAVMAG